MKTILVPIDFSEKANNAFLHGLKIANQLGLPLYVLHCYQSPVLSFSHAGQPDLLQDVYKEIELSKFDFFKNRVPSLRQLAGEHQLEHGNITFIFEEGTLHNVLRKVVEREQVRLVVMGSNPFQVVNNIRVPVLVVPEQASFAAIKKVAFTTLFREKDKAALQEIIQLASYVEAQVHVVHIIDGKSSPADILQYSEEWRKAFHGNQLNFILVEKTGSVEQTIQEFMAENQIDLLAVVKRNRNFFERLIRSSISNNLAFHTSTPVLVFHEEPS